VAAALPPLEVAVLMGGPSEERGVSLVSGAAVAQGLREAGHRVTEIVFDSAELPPIPPATDVVFPVLHGTFGEDGALQALLEGAGWPYVGSGPEASRATMEKSMTKERLLATGLPTPRFILVDRPDAPFPADMGLPLIVKPNAQGSSVGITRLKSHRWWRRALGRALAVDRQALVEEFIDGREITVGILHGEALPVVEIQPPTGRIYDNDAKYDHRYGHTHYHCPPLHVSPEEQGRAQAIALEVAKILQTKDMVRIDFLVDDNGTPWILEGNSIPGFTPTSLLPKGARGAGIEFPELCARLVRANV
jgi:D-alanine-D-alanine ligase